MKIHNIRALWDERYAPDLWGEFIRRAREYHNTGRLEEDEIDYKRDIGDRLAAARRAVTQGADDWIDLVKRGIGGNLVHRIEQAKFRDWMDEAPDDARFALQMLWEGDEDDPGERIASFCELLPDQASSGPGTRTTLASVLLMGLDVELYPPFRTTPFDRAYQQTAYGTPEQGTREADIYGHALEFLDRFIEEASERDLAIGNRLEAQSLVWAIQDEEQPPPRPPDENGETEIEPPGSLEDLAGELMWAPDQLRKVIQGLEDKGQVILQGPPGTGKTYVAQRIAQWYRAQGGDYQIVQFHPSYAYEDFVEGYRPVGNRDGQVRYDVVPGPLRLMAERAREKPDARFILVIDEFNRGNVSKILGELYFLLEYREEEANLQYSHGRFSLPKNLWFIATMNTTDRSIALVDAALRRRFYSFDLYPDRPPIQGLLRRWLQENNRDMLRVADLVDAANRKLNDRHLGIGPSHFMKKDPPLDESRIRFIWEQAVIPHVEDLYFGNEDRLREFSYDRLVSETNARDAAPNAAGETSDGTSVSEAGQPADGGNGAAA